MKLNKILMINVFLLCIISICAVSATDNTTKDVTSTEPSHIDSISNTAPQESNEKDEVKSTKENENTKLDSEYKNVLSGADDKIVANITTEPIINKESVVIEVESKTRKNGSLNIYIDLETKPAKNYTIIKGIFEERNSKYMHITLTDLGIDNYGTYNITVKYTPKDGTETNIAKKEIEYKNPISNLTITNLSINKTQNIIKLSTKDNGTLKIYIDDKLNVNKTVHNDSNLTYNAGHLKLSSGKHKLKITFTKNNETITAYDGYITYIHTNAYSPEFVNLNEKYDINAELPKEVTGKLTVYEGIYNSTSGTYNKGKKINSKSISGGSVKIDLGILSEGSHHYILEFSTNYATFDLYDNVTVIKNSNTVTVTIKPTTFEYGSSAQIHIKSENKADLKVSIDNKEVDTFTDISSESLNIGGLKVGKHTIHIEVVNPNTKKPLYANTFTITVNPKKYEEKAKPPAKTTTKTKTTISLSLKKLKTLKKSAKKIVLHATLKINEKVAKSKKVTFKFNGKKYTAKTNSKGIVKVTIKKAVLKKLKVGKKITYQVNYSTKTVKRTIKVKK